MRAIHSILTAGIMLAALSTSALALTLPVSEDTSTNANAAVARTAGKDTTLRVSASRQGLIRFEAGAFADSVSAGDVSKARLVLFISGVTAPGALTLHRVTQDWSEAGARVPAYDAAPLATIPQSSVVAKQFVIIEVTAAVQAWLREPGTDFGFAIVASGGTRVLLGAKEGPGAGYPAQLQIEAGRTEAGDEAAAGGRSRASAFAAAGFFPTSAIITNFDIANNSIKGKKLKDASVLGTKLALATVTADKLDPNIGLWSASGGDVVRATGNVGIGTATPATKLEVAGTIKGTSFAGDGAGLTNIPASAVATAPPGMALIPAGAFTMGNSVAADTDITDATPVSTTVSAFYMDVNEVTLSQWESVYYWATSNGYSFSAGVGKGANHPVQTVSWYDVVKWCNARSEQAGRTPVYYTDDAQTTVYRTGNVDVTNAQVQWSANGYRLPTEAEWEKAARGGLGGQRFPWGNTITQNLANYFGATASYAYDLGPDGYNAIGSVGGTSPATSPVGSFAANGYGLSDMAGNVFEWCWDWYGTPYAGGTDPHGPASGSTRVFRGGGWFCIASSRDAPTATTSTRASLASSLVSGLCWPRSVSDHDA